MDLKVVGPNTGSLLEMARERTVETAIGRQGLAALARMVLVDQDQPVESFAFSCSAA